MSKDNRLSLFAGLLIGLGAYGFLALGGIPGAVIFAFGLVGVVLSGTLLYTGKAGVMTDIGALAKIWLFNVLGCILIGLLVLSIGGEPMERAQTVVAGRLAQGPWRSFLRAVGSSSACRCSSCAAFTTLSRMWCIWWAPGPGVSPSSGTTPSS